MRILGVVFLLLLAALSSALAESRHAPKRPSPWTTPTAPAAKAGKPLKPCTRYGEGFYRLPGTDTCVKFGGEVRTDFSTGSGH